MVLLREEVQRLITIQNACRGMSLRHGFGTESSSVRIKSGGIPCELHELTG